MATVLDAPRRDPTAITAIARAERDGRPMDAPTLTLAFREALARPWRSAWLADCVWRCLREAEA